MENTKNETPDLAGSDVSTKKTVNINNNTVNKGWVDFAPATGREEDCGSKKDHPPSDTGVMIQKSDVFDVPDDWQGKFPVIDDEQTLGLHWLTLTLYCEPGRAFELYKDLLSGVFGDLEEQNHGLLGYRSVATGLFGFKVAYDPQTASKRHGSGYVTYIIPGAACERLGASWLRRMASECNSREIEINCTRLDYKFDQMEFSPYQFRYMLKNNVKMLVAARSKIRHIQNDDLNEIGIPGKITVYVGSSSSDRVICCYDTHGFTRLEMRNKGGRAMMIFLVLAAADTFLWSELCKRFLLDYVNFDNLLWLKFINNNKKSYMKMAKKENPTLDELERSFITQWSAAFSLLRDIKGDRWQKMVMEIGREKRKNNGGYCMIIHAYGLFKGDLE